MIGAILAAVGPLLLVCLTLNLLLAGLVIGIILQGWLMRQLTKAVEVEQGRLQ
ncbi:MAG: hypothetical protein KDI15_01195 [Thiothrix sp.]|nr:hypothetical protein [Thiothrix sp.]